MELAVVEATNQLYKQVIPQFANQVEERAILPSELITQLHKQGINIRHLGIFKSFPSPSLTPS